MSQEPTDPFATKIEAIAAEAMAALEEREPPIQLGFWPDDERAMPGDFIACALFTASKATEHVTRGQIASVHGMTVIFTGKRLTQVHADVWMGIMHLARERSSGDVVRFRGRQLLNLIGRYTHAGQREQLKNWISELGAAQVLIQDDAKRKRYGGSLLPWQEETDGEYFDVFKITISRELARLLSGNYWRIDWPLRKRLQKKPLALWLQTYFARFNRPAKVAHLHELSGSTSSLKKFRQNLGFALDELHEAGGFSAEIDRETDTVRSTSRRPAPKKRPPVEDTQGRLFAEPDLRIVK